jgi:thioredoxin type arsenate reductase
VLRAAPPRAILFLCVANSARSQMAEAIGRAEAPPGVRVYSAGSEPKSVHPLAIRVSAEIGLDMTGQQSKSVSQVPATEIDTVITLCAEEACPVFPGEVRRVHWALPDPAAAGGTEEERLAAFRKVRDELRERIRRVFSAPES